MLGDLPPDLLSRSTGPDTLEHVRRTNAASYATTFPADTALHQRVLWPAAPAESNGMEDARFVRFADEAGPVYRATYTAYDGRRIATRALASSDLRRFEMHPDARAGRPQQGHRAVPAYRRRPAPRAVPRRRRDHRPDHAWTARTGGRTRCRCTPRADSWELIQVGNCGSPIETDAGWLVLTHGVGPMRRYAIGALLLDLHRPERVVAELPGALLAPDEADRDGYVPNVVYSCGGARARRRAVAAVRGQRRPGRFRHRVGGRAPRRDGGIRATALRPGRMSGRRHDVPDGRCRRTLTASSWAARTGSGVRLPTAGPPRRAMAGPAPARPRRSGW